MDAEFSNLPGMDILLQCCMRKADLLINKNRKFKMSFLFLLCD
ncbi:hypothetical protein NC99_09400 [Sunxiuqinia dokdonensis]|uniref:Uncharacterized protein n=1 Tax=Sunxiuqinia dokdonensis TaxID=1409788 RepID=A0A0L8VCP7_9BACT|nr:hypothetical protein NC99_09400 [Sunxiuqinia dokdonensis]